MQRLNVYQIEDLMVQSFATISSPSSRKHLRSKVTPDFHLTYIKNGLTYSKNGGKSGVKIKMIRSEKF